MDLLLIFTASFGVALSGALAPGPLLLITIEETVSRGKKAGFSLIIGHALLELGLVFGFLYGLHHLLENYLIIRLISLLGGSFLVWMGINILKDIYLQRLSLEFGGTNRKKRKTNPVWLGIIASLSNPYWTLWWATAGVTLALLALKRGYLGLSFFFVGHILGDFVWYGLVITAIVSGRKIISEGIYRGILVVCALFLVLLGACFVGGLDLINFVTKIFAVRHI